MPFFKKLFERPATAILLWLQSIYPQPIGIDMDGIKDHLVTELAGRDEIVNDCLVAELHELSEIITTFVYGSPLEVLELRVRLTAHDQQKQPYGTGLQEQPVCTEINKLSEKKS